MPTQSPPTKTALLLIDFINALDFDGAEALRPMAVKAAARTAELKRRAAAAGVPVIYANDNFGNWRSEFSHVVRACEESPRGRELVHTLRPGPDDWSVLKPRHSAFYGTPLEFLLDDLEVERLILTGLQTDICVLFTAHDAYLRQYELWVPGDCVASEKAADSEAALQHMASILKADTWAAGDPASKAWLP